MNKKKKNMSKADNGYREFELKAKGICKVLNNVIDIIKKRERKKDKNFGILGRGDSLIIAIEDFIESLRDVHINIWNYYYWD